MSEKSGMSGMSNASGTGGSNSSGTSSSSEAGPSLLPLQYRRAAGCVVLRKAAEGAGIEVLLIETPVQDAPCLPKGGVEAGESDEEAAVRETWEETGHHVAILDFDPVIVRALRVNRLPHLELTIRFYLAESTRSEPIPDLSRHESAGASFVPIDEAFKRMHFPEEVEALTRTLIRFRSNR